MTSASYAFAEEFEYPSGATLEETSAGLQVEVLGNRLRVLIEGTAPAWFEPAMSKLDQLFKLRRNWDSYGAYPLNPYSAAAAIRFLGWTMQQNTVRPALIPTVTGDITLEWHTDGIDLEVTLEAEGARCLLFEDQERGVTVEVERPDPNLLREVMLKLPTRAPR